MGQEEHHNPPVLFLSNLLSYSESTQSRQVAHPSQCKKVGICVTPVLLKVNQGQLNQTQMKQNLAEKHKKSTVPIISHLQWRIHFYKDGSMFIIQQKKKKTGRKWLLWERSKPLLTKKGSLSPPTETNKKIFMILQTFGTRGFPAVSLRNKHT